MKDRSYPNKIAKLLIYTVCVAIYSPMLLVDVKASTQNKNSKTYANGEYYAGAVDVSFGSKSSSERAKL